MAFIKNGKKEYEIPEGSTAKETFESLKMAIPELANSKLVKDGPNYKTQVSYGKKG